MTVKWSKYFLNMASFCAIKSKDRSTHVGVVIVGEDNEVLSTGFNGFPRGVDDDVESRHERPAKYQYTEHGERNAIYNAARNGIRLKGSTLYLNYSPYAICTDCARAIVQSGIKEVVGNNVPFPRNNPNWVEDFKVSEEILTEGGVIITNIKES